MSLDSVSSSLDKCVLVGPQDLASAFARINKAWWRSLALSPAWLRADSLAQIDDIPDAQAVVVHDFSLDFETLHPPERLASAIVRPWDFGPYPPAWRDRINGSWDQLWIHSEWSRELALRGGIDPANVTLIPLGVDVESFRPDGPTMELPTSSTTRFLFVGAPIRRKGLDILLQAFPREFGADDDVCLILKTASEQVFYEGQGLGDHVERIRSEGGPEILVLDRHLSTEEMAALARSATVGVFPYRAEGFSLPILEAMACGLPCIVPDFGPCLDYSDPDSCLRLPVRRMSLPVFGDYAFNTLGFSTPVDEVDFCEPKLDALRSLLRAASEMSHAELARIGSNAATKARGEFSWGHSVQAVTSAAAELLATRRPG